MEGQIDAAGLIRLSIHITDEYTEEQSDEIVRSEAKESKKYRLLANGKIKEIE